MFLGVDMSAIRYIRTRNIQSHDNVTIELPEVGLTVFQGGNSDGKSVITKMLEDLISDNIKSARTRKSLINRDSGQKCGTFEIEKYDGTKLFVNLHTDASQTWVKLTRKSGEEVTRYLADKTIPELVTEFGFHYDDTRGVTLNICDSDEAMLFFKTNHVTNYDVVSSALIDTIADRKAKQLTDAYQNAVSMRRSISNQLQVSSQVKQSIVLYDVDRERQRADKLNKIINVLSHVYMPNIIELPDPPKTPFIMLSEIRLKKLQAHPTITLPEIRISRLEEEMEQLRSIEKGVCPTCKRPFFSHQTCTKET